MRYDDPNVGLSAVIGLTGAIALFVIIVLLQALFHNMQAAETDAKTTGRPDQGVQALKADHLEQLNSYGWMSESEGVVRVPIDRAMELVVAESQGRRHQKRRWRASPLDRQLRAVVSQGLAGLLGDRLRSGRLAVAGAGLEGHQPTVVPPFH